MEDSRPIFSCKRFSYNKNALNLDHLCPIIWPSHASRVCRGSGASTGAAPMGRGATPGRDPPRPYRSASQPLGCNRHAHAHRSPDRIPTQSLPARHCICSCSATRGSAASTPQGQSLWAWKPPRQARPAAGRASLPGLACILRPILPPTGMLRACTLDGGSRTFQA